MSYNRDRQKGFDIWQHVMLTYCQYKGDLFLWNDWRIHHPEVPILLEGVSLKRAYLAGANLNHANLKSANLSKANLTKANLSGANLRKASLVSTNLTMAKLTSSNCKLANFYKAKLYKANLRKASLWKARLEKTNLREANLENARMYRADLQKSKFSKTYLKMADLREANLQYAHLGNSYFGNARLWRANLHKADLSNSILQEADFLKSNLQDANLSRVNLKWAKLLKADIQGALLESASLQSAQFYLAHVDGKTTITKCYFDNNTDFTGVGLDATTIEPDLKVALKNNIRRIRWEKWAKNGKNWRDRMIRRGVNWFWNLSAFGSSTSNIIKWFFIIAIGFGVIYWLFAMIPRSQSIIHELRHLEATGTRRAITDLGYIHTFFRSIYFSIVTMTTLGFGDMHAAKTIGWPSYLGYLFLSAQVIMGYVLLGALVTRLGVLFTSDSPAADPSPVRPNDRTDKRKAGKSRLKS